MKWFRIFGRKEMYRLHFALRSRYLRYVQLSARCLYKEKSAPKLMGSLIARFMGPTQGPSRADRTQVGPMLAPWTLLSGVIPKQSWCTVLPKRTCGMPECYILTFHSLGVLAFHRCPRTLLDDYLCGKQNSAIFIKWVIDNEYHDTKPEMWTLPCYCTGFTGKKLAQSQQEFRDRDLCKMKPIPQDVEL